MYENEVLVVYMKCPEIYAADIEMRMSEATFWVWDLCSQTWMWIEKQEFAPISNGLADSSFENSVEQSKMSAYPIDDKIAKRILMLIKTL